MNLPRRDNRRLFTKFREIVRKSYTHVRVVFFSVNTGEIVYARGFYDNRDVAVKLRRLREQYRCAYRFTTPTRSSSSGWRWLSSHLHRRRRKGVRDSRHRRQFRRLSRCLNNSANFTFVSRANRWTTAHVRLFYSRSRITRILWLRSYRV